MYPPAESLSSLELLYGEAITRTDMDGTLRPEYLSHSTEQQRLVSSRQRSREAGQRSRAEAEEEKKKKKKSQRKRDEFVFTDCRNAEFEEYLRNRPVHRVDHLEENRALRMEAWEDMLRRRETQTLKATQTLQSVLGDAPPHIFLYSQQTLNYKALAMSKLRETISQDHDASYTFSKNFMSQTLAAVDETEQKKKLIADEKVL